MVNTVSAFYNNILKEKDIKDTGLGTGLYGQLAPTRSVMVVQSLFLKSIFWNKLSY